MRTASLLLFAACLAGAAAAQDAMGGFDRPYTNAGNVFGKGAWGDGSGTATPLPDPGAEYGMYYDQPYSGSSGSNLFGSGFWTAEYMVRRAEGGVGGGRVYSTEAVYEGGPLGHGHAEGHDKGGHDKGQCGCGGKDHGKDKHGKKFFYKEKIIYKEKTRYIPYQRTQKIVVARRSTSVVVVERVKTSDLGRLNVVLQARTQRLAAVCIDGKGNEHPAIRVSTSDGGRDYDGEVFRCAGDRMLRVSFETGSADIAGAVRTADGSSYKDCDGGDALVRTRDGALMCRAKRPMSAKIERSLEARGDDYAEAAYETGSAADDLSPGQIDLSGLELTGGVGN